MSQLNPNLPKSFLALRNYQAADFVHDLIAGLTVGLVALPLAMACPASWECPRARSMLRCLARPACGLPGSRRDGYLDRRQRRLEHARQLEHRQAARNQ